MSIDPSFIVPLSRVQSMTNIQHSTFKIRLEFFRYNLTAVTQNQPEQTYQVRDLRRVRYLTRRSFARPPGLNLTITYPNLTNLTTRSTEILVPKQEYRVRTGVEYICPLTLPRCMAVVIKIPQLSGRKWRKLECRLTFDF